ncbi:hypothetical protein OESDEN_12346 [Oesophagostomum dentatum]|uniref:C-type lectin domain-containing protein n=1 Tax=Oesophagostomum dentatum TaxID=61180 RepID=A0A0B1SSD2_OESDE|nr:hypothetical protein OESDEN_12346 [Oesophagostomum dentatum]
MFFKSSLLFCVISVALSITINTDNLHCPTGWISHLDSCYFFDNPILEHDKAQAKCWELGSTLLVAETLDEWEYVMERSAVSAWSWIGMTQDEELHFPRWDHSGGMDPLMVNWLVKPYISTSNGWSTQAKCAAHLNVPVAGSDYTFFLPCNIQVYSICEKNATLFPRIWDHGLVGL